MSANSPNLAGAFARDGAWLLAARIASMAVGIVGLPVMISGLGYAQFGVWSVLLGGVFAFGTLELGIASSVMRWSTLALHRGAEGDAEEGIDAVLTNAIACTSVIFALGGVILAIVAAPLAAWLKLPTTPLLTPAQCLLWVYGTVAAVALLRSGVILMQSSGHFRAFALTSVLQSLACAAATWPIAWATNRLDLLLVANTGAILMVQGGAAAWARKRARWTLQPRLLSLRLVGAMLRHGSALQFADLANFVLFQLDKMLIAGLVAPSEVAHYEVASRSVQSLGQLPTVPYAAVVPGLTRHFADRSDLGLPILHLMRITLVGIGFTLLLPLAVAPIGLFAWVGQVGYQAAPLFSLLVMAVMANLLVLPLSICAQAMGRAPLDMRRSLLAIVINVPLSFVLIKQYGNQGAALGTLVACLTANTLFARRFLHLLQVDAGWLLRALWPIAWRLLLAFLALCLAERLIEPLVISSRWKMAPAVVVLYAITATCVGSWLLRSPALRPEDKQLLVRIPRLGPLLARFMR